MIPPDRIKYLRQKRERELANMRAAFRIREEAVAVIKAERQARMRILSEEAERRRAIERAEAQRQRMLELRDPGHPLYHIAVANNLGGREYSQDEIKALHPCGRFDTLKRNHFGNTFRLDARQAILQGASLNDLVWVAQHLSMVNEEAKLRYKRWIAVRKGRNDLDSFVLAFSEDIT